MYPSRYLGYTPGNITHSWETFNQDCLFIGCKMSRLDTRVVGKSNPKLSFLDMVFLYSVPQIWILAGNCQLQYHYVGCFYDNSNQSSSLSRSFVSDTQSVSSCIRECMKKPYTDYARLQNGNECYCANDYDVQLPDDVCRQTCVSNQSEYCGGNANNHLAYVIYTVCPAGSFGPACDKVCHCKRQIPCNRKTGECPDGCHGIYTGQKCDEINKSEQYIGCFKDRIDNRALTYGITSLHQNSWIHCTNICATSKSSYAGLEYAVECYCGENYNKHGQLKEDNCNQACPAYQSEMCGGPDAMTVYSTCPAGHYGKSCIQICNCVNNGRCVYANGSCPETAECAPGWSGRSCSNRDCRVQNGNCLWNEICSTVDLKFANINVCRCAEGYDRSKMLKNCSDVNECNQKPSICGPLGVNCINTEGGYICLCRNGNYVVNQTCPADYESCIKEKERLFTRSNTGIVVGSVLGLVAITVILLLLLKLYRNHTRTNESTAQQTTSVQATLKDSVEHKDKTQLPTRKGPAKTETTGYATHDRSADDETDYQNATIQQHESLELKPRSAHSRPNETTKPTAQSAGSTDNSTYESLNRELPETHLYVPLQK